MINRFVVYTGLICLLVACLSAVATGIVTKILRHQAILDQPNDRSSHSVPTPRGGGWGLMAALLPVWSWAVWKSGRLHDPVELLLLCGAVALIAVSWIDDRRNLGAAPRLLTQIVSVALVMAVLPHDLSLSNGLLPPILDRVVAGLVWLWFVNLFNFMDGIDGIAGGSAAAMGFGVMLVSLRYGPSELDAFRGAIIAAAGLGFLWWNWRPAKVFMGDVGSIPLGYLLGYELIRLAMDRGQVFALIIPLYYLADATITLARRGLRGERVWRAHREHFYQRSVQLGRSHARTAKTAILVQCALAVFAWLAALFGAWWLIPSVLLVGLLLCWMARPPRPA